VLLQLRHVPTNGAPTANLPQVILAAAARVISAIPLEPTARVLGMKPTFATPFRERLRRVHAKIIQRCPRTSRRELRPLEPVRRKFLPAIGHVFPAEYAKLEHLFRLQLRRKPGTERAAHGLSAEVYVSLLHFVVHLDPHRIHLRCSCRAGYSLPAEPPATALSHHHHAVVRSDEWPL